MINMQLLDGGLLALAVLVGAAIVLSVTMLAAARVVAKRSQPPHGGIHRDLPQHPQPDTDDTRTLADEARELMLV